MTTETEAPTPSPPPREAVAPPKPAAQTGTASPTHAVWLDYGKAARTPRFISNLSAVAVAGEHLWTASDEVRTIECLVHYRSGYRLKKQYALDELH